MRELTHSLLSHHDILINPPANSIQSAFHKLMRNRRIPQNRSVWFLAFRLHWFFFFDIIQRIIFDIENQLNGLWLLNIDIIISDIPLHKLISGNNGIITRATNLLISFIYRNWVAFHVLIIELDLSCKALTPIALEPDLYPQATVLKSDHLSVQVNYLDVQVAVFLNDIVFQLEVLVAVVVHYENATGLDVEWDYGQNGLSAVEV